jgi:hypothetical protein
MHASGRIGEGSASGKKRLSSFHAYPDGSVIFSDPTLKPFNKGPDDATAAGPQATERLTAQENVWQRDEKTGRYWRWAADGKTAEWAPVVEASAADAGLSYSAQLPAQQQVSDWVLDEDSQKYKYWDGLQWVFQ